MKNLNKVLLGLLWVFLVAFEVEALVGGRQGKPLIPLQSKSIKLPIDSALDREPVFLTDLKAKCDGIEYVDRNFHVLSSMGDTPTRLANDMMAGKKKFIIIQGHRGSGKTVTLTKMLSVLREESPTTQTVFWDMNNFPADYLYSATPPNTNEGVSGEQLYKLVPNLEANPPRVNLLVDNVDKLPAETRSKFFKDLQGFMRKGTGVVLTTTDQNLGWKLGQIETVVEIPGLNSVEIEQFMTRHWDKELGVETAEKHADYAKAVAKALEGDAIPKDFRTIKELKALLVDGDRNVFSGEKKFVSVREYALGETSNPQEVLKMLDEVKINKLKLMEIVTASSARADLVRELGIRALTKVLSSEYPMLLSRPEIKNLETNNPSTKVQHLVEFMKVDSAGQEVFVHSEYERYFAAKYVIDQMRAGSTIVREIPKIILANPKYHGMAEYLNAAIMQDGRKKYKPIFKSMTRSLQNKVLDNAIVHGFDEIAAAVTKKMNRGGMLQDYFEKSNSLYESKFINKFGMMTETDRVIQSDLQEMIFRKNMDKTIKTIQKIFSASVIRGDQPSYNLWNYEKFPKYLEEIVLAQPQPNIETFRIVKKYIPTEKFTPEFANKLVHTAVSHECMDIRVYNELIQLGATPSTFNVNGETLVHAAVKNVNAKLLKFVINELKVAVPTAPESKLLFTALDTNPLNRYSASDFWKTMEILVEHGIEIPKRSNVKNYAPTATEKASPAYKLFTGEADSASRMVTDLKLSSALLDEVSPSLKSYRRNAVLSSIGESLLLDKATLTEILLAYRGLDTLPPSEQSAYENCVRRALKSDAERGLSSTQKSRIVQALSANIATRADIEFTTKFIADSNVISAIGDHAFTIENQLQTRRTENKSPEPKTHENPLLEEALRKRFHEYPYPENRETEPSASTSATKSKLIPVVNEPEFEGIFKTSPDGKLLIDSKKLQMVSSKLKDTDSVKLEKLLKLKKEWIDKGAKVSSPAEVDPPQQDRISSCGGASVARCLITDTEYNDLVTVTEENGRQIRKLSTEKYIELAEKVQYTDPAKFEQLIEMGKRLVSTEGAVLVGDYTSLFWDKLGSPEIAERYNVIGRDATSQHLDESGDYKLNDHKSYFWDAVESPEIERRYNVLGRDVTSQHLGELSNFKSKLLAESSGSNDQLLHESDPYNELFRPRNPSLGGLIDDPSIARSRHVNGLTNTYSAPDFRPLLVDEHPLQDPLRHSFSGYSEPYDAAFRSLDTLPHPSVPIGEVNSYKLPSIPDISTSHFQPKIPLRFGKLGG